jgi:hypothetical protein
VDQAQVVTASNQTLMSNQIIVASWQFIATDANGGALAAYTLNEEAIGNGSFVMNEVVQQTSTATAALDHAPVVITPSDAPVSGEPSLPSASNHPEAQTIISPAFYSDATVAPFDQAPIMHGSQDAAITLLAQYNAAGFQVETDAGALVSSAQPSLNTNNPTLISLPSQKI